MKVNFLKLPAWLQSNVFYRAKLNGNSDDPTITETVRVHPYDANLISSIRVDEKHVLLLDLDMEHFYVPSSTPGHGHLYINAELTYDQLYEILQPLVKYGIVQRGIYEGFLRRGWLSLRLPGQAKGTEDDLGLEEIKKLKGIE